MTGSLASLKNGLADRLLAFPATPFRADLSLDLDRLATLVDRLATGGAQAMFPAAGAGEFFSLSPDEFDQVVVETGRVVAGRMPVICGIGYGAGLAKDFARRAEKAGADAVLIFPPYLVQAEQHGLGHHIRDIARSIGIGVILYARDNAFYSADLLDQLVDECPNIVAVKDGIGDVASLQEIVRRLSGRMLVLGGMPTAELSAVAYRALGITSYSSAVYNFVPALAMQFFRGLDADPSCVNRLLDRFYIPLSKLRARRRGYAVSVVKAGLRVCGLDCGGVRPPLVDFTIEESNALLRLIEDNA